MQLKKIVVGISIAMLSGAVLTGCGGSSSSGLSDAEKAAAQLVDAKKVLETNADIAYASYADSVDTAQILLDKIKAFRESPTEVNFTAAKEAWLVSREPYGQTEVYRFRESPIDSVFGTNDNEDGPEGSINAWPLGEALIDDVVTGSDFGADQVGVTAHGTNVGLAVITGSDVPQQNIINTHALTIDKALLGKSASAEDERDVISGYHAIEFLLWGQDLNGSGGITDSTDRHTAVKAHGATIATGGLRPLTDFTGTNGDRRLAYLEVAAQLLVDELTVVRDQWKKGVADNYRADFTGVTTQAQADAKIKEILTGMGTLSEGELAGERMQIALAANSQEDEHSCFSDNTHRDVWLNAEGVSNSYYGKYSGYDANLDGTDSGDNVARAVTGYGLDAYTKAYATTDLAATLSTKLAVTKVGYKAIDALARAGKPFDVLIQNKSGADAKPVRETIVALNSQSAAIEAIAAKLGIAGVVDDGASGCDTTNPTLACP